VIFLWWQESNYFFVTIAHLSQAHNPTNPSLASGVYVFFVLLNARCLRQMSLVDYYTMYEHRVDDFKEIWRYCQRRDEDQGQNEPGEPGLGVD
jgi:hypothetical protein